MPTVKKFPIEKEYDKNPDISPDDVKKLRAWLTTQPHLPVDLLTVGDLPPAEVIMPGERPCSDYVMSEFCVFACDVENFDSVILISVAPSIDLDLLVTFHCCDKSAEVAKQVLDLHFTLRTLFTGFFKDRSLDQKVLAVTDTILITPLSAPSVGGYKVMYCRVLNNDPRYFNFCDTIRTFMMIFDLLQYGEGTWPGFVIIIDMDQTVLGHIAKLDIMTIRQTLYFLQECMLVKLKEVHFINAPSFMEKLMMMLRPFMKKSLLDIIRIHQVGSDSLYKFVPKAALPKESGGEEKDWISLKNERLQLLKDNPEFFKMENLRRVNETLRPGGKPATVEDLFGIQGSFKKLDID